MILNIYLHTSVLIRLLGQSVITSEILTTMTRLQVLFYLIELQAV